MARLRYTIEVETERVSGKFASKDAMSEEIESWLEAANQEQLDVDESEYEVVDWSITRNE
jgi:hypothetical protein